MKTLIEILSRKICQMGEGARGDIPSDSNGKNASAATAAEAGAAGAAAANKTEPGAVTASSTSSISGIRGTTEEDELQDEELEDTVSESLLKSMADYC